MNDPILDKLRKLIAMEKSARSIGSLAEAEAFASKVQELLSKHKLEMSEVELNEQEESDPIDWEHVATDDAGFRTLRSGVLWQIQIADGIAKANGCRMIRANRSNNVIFAGRKSDRELCKILFIYILELSKEMNTKAAKEYKRETLKRVQQTYGGVDIAPAHLARLQKEFKQSWYFGFAEAVRARFIAKWEEMKAQYAQCAAIVHIDQTKKLVDEFLKGKIGRGRSMQRNLSNESGYNSGKSSGEAINLTPHTFTGATGRASRLLPA